MLQLLENTMKRYERIVFSSGIPFLSYLRDEVYRKLSVFGYSEPLEDHGYFIFLDLSSSAARQREIAERVEIARAGIHVIHL